MNSEQNSLNTKGFTEESETDNTLSIDEFFKQLEAKEKDLDISSDLIIQVDESGNEDQDISDFLLIDLSASPNKPEPKIIARTETVPKTLEPTNHQTEVIKLQDQITRLETERVELFELARRRQSDFENYKNRTERERSETFRKQLSNLATQMLPVVDNLNRAMDLSNTISEEKPKDFQQFFEGIMLVSQQLNEILAEMGVQPIIAVGEPFDPNFHEAVATEVTNEVPAQTVTSELLRGYRIGDKVVRPSMVKVSVSTESGNLPELPANSGENFS